MCTVASSFSQWASRWPAVAFVAWRWWPPALWALVLLLPLLLLGLHDVTQRRRAVLRNWPVIGHFRYMFEAIRPEIQQYFVESNTDGTPVNREMRALAYQRAKRTLDTLPFGTQHDVYQVGYEWIHHSVQSCEPVDPPPRVPVGGPACTQPYDASLLNVSAMSYGSLSKNAILALNEGARRGGFAHNTGEGGISPYHLEHGGDLVFQFGTGYFGCRTADGDFDEAAFRDLAALPSVRMIEVKLSQGAKPGHGGILPAVKVTEEISRIRRVPMGRDVLSPPYHRAFRTPRGLIAFIARVREAAGGKPVGFKLCVGDLVEFLSICKAMCELDVTPDFIAVDGGEGGTGAAPVEFTNRVGMPLRDGLHFAHSALLATGLRQRIRLFAAGKVLSGFDMVRAFALGADGCNSARGMMFALGCIQARRCNSNDCPVGVATQRSALVRGLDVEDKAARVANYHHETMHAFFELIAAAGIEDPAHVRPYHVWRRIDNVNARHYGQIYECLPDNVLIDDPGASGIGDLWDLATPDRFAAATGQTYDASID